MDLASKQCIPCRGDVPPLKGDQLAELHSQLDEGWEVIDEHHLAKDFKFRNFADALAYVNRVGEMAEEQGHLWVPKTLSERSSARCGGLSSTVAQLGLHV